MESNRSLLDRINKVTPFMEVEQETATEETIKLSLVSLIQKHVPGIDTDEALVTKVAHGEDFVEISISKGKVERTQLPVPLITQGTVEREE